MAHAGQKKDRDCELRCHFLRLSDPVLVNPRTRIALFFFVAVMALPAVAVAQPMLYGAPRILPGKVPGPLRGTPADPRATTLHVTPPRGGMVMLHRNNRMLQWYTSSAMVTLQPGVTYGITATRGGTMLFNQRVILQPGVTQLSWSSNGAPALSYRPAFPAPGRYRRSATERTYGAAPRRPATRRPTRRAKPLNTSQPRVQPRQATAGSRKATKTPKPRPVSRQSRIRLERSSKFAPTPRRMKTARKRRATPAKPATKRRSSPARAPARHFRKR